MTDSPTSCRTIVISGEKGIRDRFKQAATASCAPVDLVETDSSAAAKRALADGADLIFLDDALPSGDILQIVTTARGLKNAPLTLLMAQSKPADAAFETDALTIKPEAADETQRLIDGAIRMRRGMRVLVVDDSSTMRNIVRKVLGATRFPLEIVEANDGSAALKAARESDFGAIFLDYNMPGLSGLEALSELKREKRAAYIVVITSSQDQKLAEQVDEQGAALLRKPFFPEDVEATLCNVCGFRALNAHRH
jgi:CheY-like chemotaxis protein